MVSHESKFGLTFRSWWRSTRMRGVFELKDTRGKGALPFSEVAEAQIDSGMANKSKKGNLVRIQSGTAGTGDYAAFVGYPTYIVVKYPKCFEVIEVETFDMERKRSKMKSLTAGRAREISIVTVKTAK